MSISVTPPPSSAPEQAAANTSAKPIADASNSLNSAPPPGRIVVHYPLASFASNPHNVACISFLLGGLWSLGLWSATALLTSKQLWWTLASDASLPPQGFLSAIQSPLLGLYLSFWAFFHLMEFVVTSMWNPGKLTVSSFLLDNGKEYHVAHLVGIAEHVLEEAYLPAHWRLFKHSGAIVSFGIALVVGGQILRSYAMKTASSNFSHVVAFKKLPTHQLVKTGIYAWSRHPSYAAFTWWAVGTQILLGNAIGTAAFCVALYHFFSTRIEVEERLLVKFFGDDYIKYRQEVPTRILFIS